MKNLIIIIFAFFFTFSCTSTEVNDEKEKSSINKSNLNDLAKQKFGENFVFTTNSSKQYTLYKSGINVNMGLEYFVYDNKNKSILYEGKVPNGDVSWHSEHELKIIEIPGIIQKNSTGENGYIINIKTNSRTKLNGGVN